MYVTNSKAQKIFEYIKKGEIDKVENWINKKGNQVNQLFPIKNNSGVLDSLHILEYAAYHNQKEIVKLFIQNKNRFDNYQEWISDALGANIHNCDTASVKIILDAGASINSFCQMCRKASPIAIALSYECYDVYNLLIANGAQLVNENSGYDVIHAAAQNDSLQFLIDLVENRSLDVNQEDANFKVNSAFYAALKNLKNLQYLIEKGADFRIVDSEGYSILYYASNLEIFNYLEELLIVQDGKNFNDLINKKSLLISTIITKDDKDFFDYYIKKYPKFILPQNGVSDNPLFSLLETSVNTEYFLNELLKRKMNLYAEDEYGLDLKFYAKKMKKQELLDAIKRYEKSHK